MSTIVYTKPRCVQCTATYRALDKAGVAYASVDITEDAEAYSKLVELGFKQAPVVASPIGNWSGFNPGKIEELKQYFAGPVG